MYPIKCAAGFSIPLKGGRFCVSGISATVADPTAASRLALVDDSNIKGTQGYVLDTITNVPFVLCDLKGVSNTTGNLSVIFDEPIKTRYGISAYFDNLVPGSICVYME